MTRDEKLHLIRQSALVAIIRAKKLTAEELLSIATALEEGGVQVMELTLTTPGALELVTAMKGRSKALFGVGSVLNEEQAKASMDAGADFLVTPTLSPAVVRAAVARKIPIFAGCYTPTEAQTAYELGADFIKLFPAEFGGPALVKAILAPLPHLSIVPVGGVSVETTRAFLQAGAVALGVGSSLVNQKVIDEKNWGAITQEAARFSREIAAERARS